jgi:hypothetical protein
MHLGEGFRKSVRRKKPAPIECIGAGLRRNVDLAIGCPKKKPAPAELASGSPTTEEIVDDHISVRGIHNSPFASRHV